MMRGRREPPFAFPDRTMPDSPPAPVEERKNSPQWILAIAVRSACPRCGKGMLFQGFLTLAKRCNLCGLDYSFADPADGPAFFVMMTMAFPITALGIWIELAFEPPVWV